MSDAKTTHDHAAIKAWTEERKGRPSRVAQEGGDEHSGILRIDFQEPDDKLEEISWEEFFEIFDNSKLEFLHQDKTAAGKISRFNKFVSRAKKG